MLKIQEAELNQSYKRARVYKKEIRGEKVVNKYLDHLFLQISNFREDFVALKFLQLKKGHTWKFVEELGLIYVYEV